MSRRFAQACQRTQLSFGLTSRIAHTIALARWTGVAHLVIPHACATNCSAAGASARAARVVQAQLDAVDVDHVVELRTRVGARRLDAAHRASSGRCHEPREHFVSRHASPKPRCWPHAHGIGPSQAGRRQPGSCVDERPRVRLAVVEGDVHLRHSTRLCIHVHVELRRCWRAGEDHDDKWTRAGKCDGRQRRTRHERLGHAAALGVLDDIGVERVILNCNGAHVGLRLERHRCGVAIGPRGAGAVEVGSLEEARAHLRRDLARQPTLHLDGSDRAACELHAQHGPLAVTRPDEPAPACKDVDVELHIRDVFHREDGGSALSWCGWRWRRWIGQWRWWRWWRRLRRRWRRRWG